MSDHGFAREVSPVAADTLCLGSFLLDGFTLSCVALSSRLALMELIPASQATPEDSLVFGGNFVHSYDVRTREQLNSRRLCPLAVLVSSSVW